MHAHRSSSWLRTATRSRSGNGAGCWGSSRIRFPNCASSLPLSNRERDLTRASAPFPGCEDRDDGCQEQSCQGTVEQRRDGVRHPAQRNKNHDPKEGRDNHRRIKKCQSQCDDAVPDSFHPDHPIEDMPFRLDSEIEGLAPTIVVNGSSGSAFQHLAALARSSQNCRDAVGSAIAGAASGQPPVDSGRPAVSLVAPEPTLPSRSRGAQSEEPGDE